ncbi:UDP-N-acetylglucosamine-peptide N-acetylglucosaminyltransferase [Metallibacterium sp.]|uniref:O-linked N-acetylglucosamine transferase, SPINDLY family protein n=1 Tax=Metallibacterium sp. TaxID=2940281 RepID=UPI002636E87C|nr:UDP-N-acetylglucosamine-peptide N-acetylglucosaminyltransferase [Metallibacterium sp.]
MNIRGADDPIAALTRITALLEQGAAAAAEVQARALWQRRPADGEAARLHGLALLLLGRISDSIESLRMATRLAPQSIAAWLNLAGAARDTGDLALAQSALDAALAIDGAHPAALDQLGSLRRAQGDAAGARTAYAQALARGGAPATALNLAAVELETGATAQATARAATLCAHPQAPAAAFLLLAQARAAQRDFGAAEAACTAGLARCAGDAGLLYQAGLLAEEQGQHARAAQCYRDALRRDPGNLRSAAQLQFAERQCCDWREVDARGAWLRAQLAAGRAGVAPFAFLAEPATPAEQRRCAEIAAQALAARLPAPRALALRPRTPGAPLRVGLLSAGFHQHATALLLTPMLEALTRDASLDLRLYALSPDDGSTWRQCLAACAPLLDASVMPDDALAACLRSDALDVLIDIEVWCGGGRPQVLARRPAPLQVQWLGYPGTGGAPWWDALIADEFVIPPGRRGDYREQVAYLPRCYQPVDAARAIVAPPPRTALGLPERGTVYACFGQNYKLTPQRFAGCMDILRAVPGSVLWLLASFEEAHTHLREVARAAGVDPARLVFAARRTHGEYLGLFRHADLLLDTDPYNAHTTASDALYAGCPVLTCPGATFASRVAGSLNHHAGLAECNARDEPDFIARAVALGRDAAARAALRTRVAQARGSGVFDAAGYARDFAALLHALRAGAAAR